ncbi:MAG: peptide/nickel transport system permease protein [Thermomicrobiales bacterium]|jgi:peptide/nickel transport system permease protein|nr:peptide/nickel transport system permease protein [Thermomicrobiales bacterium]MEA2584205.1 peptide/nickel transport system permease protein [Thermomicrobiales bacterium]
MVRAATHLGSANPVETIGSLRRSGWSHHPAVAQFLRNRVAVAALVLLVAMTIVAYFAPQLAPYNPTKVAVTQKLRPPSSDHLLGTDQFGRDVFSRLLWGARLTVYYAFIGVGLAAGAGVVLGAIAGYARGWLDSVIMRSMDILLAFPGLLLALVVLTILGSGLVNAQVAVGVSLIPVYVRLVRGTMLSAREREHVLAARVTGCRPMRLMVRHILPSVWSQVAVLSTTALGWSIVIAATLNFLGLGVKPPTPEWGADLAAGRQWLSVGWWVSTGPGAAITIVILAISYLGDGLTEALDPNLRRR